MSLQRRKSAVALMSDPLSGGHAPRLVAKGYGLVAETIVQRAKEAGLYVHESPEMVSLLMQVDLDSRIPPRLYQAVAELLAWLHQLEAAPARPAGTAQPAQSAAAPPPAAARPAAPPMLPPPPLRTSSST